MVDKPIVYISNYNRGAISRAEFTRASSDRMSFFHIRPNANLEEICQQLQSVPISLHISSTVKKANGETLLICHGRASPGQMVQALAGYGEKLELPNLRNGSFDPWVWRGITSFVGQSLQIASSLAGKGTASDRAALMGFASLNLLANLSNIIFGAQEKSDPHHLKRLKRDFNQHLAPYIGDISELPDPDDDRLNQRTSFKEHKTRGKQAYEFMEKYSVSFGEIGLRLVGATSLAFPFPRVARAFKALNKGSSLNEVFKLAKNENPVTFQAGLTTLAGKFVSLTSKEPDPYNPKPHTAIDTFREKISFPASSVIEGAAAAYMMNDRFKNQKIAHPFKKGQEMADYYGGMGNAVFVGGYGIRFMAPYGTREVNIPELFAHITDGLAKVPHEQLPHLLAETAMRLKEHFGNNVPHGMQGEPFEVSNIYAHLADELEKTHHITLDHPDQFVHDPSHTQSQIEVAHTTHPDHTERPDHHQVTVAVHEQVAVPAEGLVNVTV